VSPKIVKLPHLTAANVVNPLASAPATPAPRMAVAHEIDGLAGLWSTAPDDPMFGPTETGEVTIDDLYAGGLEAARALTATEGADIDVADTYRGPRPSGRAERFRVDRPLERLSRQEAADRSRMTVVAPTPRVPAPPEPARPLTPMQRAAQYTDRTATVKRLLRGD
jgi:hypothetical protein